MSDRGISEEVEKETNFSGEDRDLIADSKGRIRQGMRGRK